jgi:solute carrier family 30 (zinc transporter), member 9
MFKTSVSLLIKEYSRNSSFKRFTAPRVSSLFLLRVSSRPFSSDQKGDPLAKLTSPASTTATEKIVEGKVVPKIKTDIIYNDQVKSEKYITPLRALKEYMLSMKDLEGLPKYYSRSPYSYETKTLVYHRSDVENMAYKKHGGKDIFEIRSKLTKTMEKRQVDEVFNLKKAWKYMQDTSTSPRPSQEQSTEKIETLFNTGAGRVILAAIAVNSLNCALKAVAWIATGSKSMFSEMMHSFADTMNQIILAIGLHTSLHKPDQLHPYGYLPLRNVSSLISGVGIFFVGSSLSVWQGVQGILHPQPIDSLLWALVLMGGSLLSEGATLLMAYNHARTSALKEGYTLRQYLTAGFDPSTSVVLLEDMVAVIGVTVAGGCLALSHYTGSMLPDAVGALIVGGLLSGVACFIVWTNTQALIGRSIPIQKQDAIMRVVEKSKIIRGTYDIKATMLGGDKIRFKAEVDVDGKELTRRYLEQADLEALLKEMQAVKNQEQAVLFMLKHGDNIVNILGAEINKIEADIKTQYPTVKHIDIEIN